jgi:cytochrome c oxidase subunit 2
MQGRGPLLQGLYGKQVELRGGEVATANAAYIRESILNPKAKIVAGFEPLMPTFQGLVTEEQLMQLIEYIRSIGPPEGGTEAPIPAVPPGDRSAPRTKARMLPRQN